MAKRDIVIVLLIIALIGGMWGAVTYLDNTEHAEQTEMVYNAVNPVPDEAGNNDVLN